MNKGLRDEYVMPQWLPFDIAAAQRGFNCFSIKHVSRPNLSEHHGLKDSFDAAYSDFVRKPEPFVGSELMGIAQILGFDDRAQTLASAVIESPNSTAQAIKQAHYILGNISRIPELESRAIKRLKTKLADFPRDALSWLERARLYTILGQREKAGAAMKVALNLAPKNRHVVRSAIRFFVHFDDWEKAYFYGERAYNLNPDPQILAPLIGVATNLKKRIPNLKSISTTALGSDNILLYSETLEAIGTQQLMSGAEQPAKKFFRRAWKEPTVPVIGHSQWIIRERIPGLASERQFTFEESNEALSWLRFSFLDFDGAVASSNAWSLEEPYSRSPYILGAIAACHAGKYKVAIDIGLRGLRANPGDETLINNLVFSYLRNGDLPEAREQFNKIRHLADDESEVAFAATYGLLLMSEGDQHDGCEYYLASIDRAVKAGNRRMALRASLNFLISTIDTAKSADPELIKAIIQALPYYQDPGCYGAALTAVSKLKESGLALTPKLGVITREFEVLAHKESSHYLGLIQSRFMDVISLRGAASGPATPEQSTVPAEPPRPGVFILDGIRRLVRGL